MPQQGWLIDYFSQPAMQIWQSEDFETERADDHNKIDFWEPQQDANLECGGTSNPSSSSIFLTDDFWDPVPAGEQQLLYSQDYNSVGEWAESPTLPAFQPKASENPFAEVWIASLEEQKARAKARWLVGLTSTPSLKQRRRWVTHFEEVFSIYQHQSTFRVLTDLALDNVTADDLYAAFELKMLWSSFPTFWHRRQRGVHGPFVPPDGSKLLGWTRAVRFVNLSKGLPAESIIDRDWYDEWLGISYGDPLYWSFLDYIDARLELSSLGILTPPRTGRDVISTPDDISIDGFRIFDDQSRTFNLFCAPPSLGGSSKHIVHKDTSRSTELEDVA